MRRTLVAALALLVLAGCGIKPSGVSAVAEAPTGVAPGVTLYFVDADHRLQPDLRLINRLGTIPEAMSMLLFGPLQPELHTEIMASKELRRVIVSTRPGLIQLMVPLARYEVTQLGIDQLVCTALGVLVQSGGSKTTKVQVSFTLTTPESAKLRTCPLIH